MRTKLTLFAFSLALAMLVTACSGSLGATLAGTAANAAGALDQAKDTSGASVPPASVNPQGTETPPLRTLAVAGTGKVTLTPDIAYINVGVHTEDADVGEALSRNSDQAQAVIDALKARGVADSDIQTSNFNIYPTQQYGPTGELLDTRFAVDNTVYVTVRNLPDLGEMLDAVVSSGANSINGIQFDLADKTEAMTDARQQAVENARSLAEEMAAATGVELGQIQSINVNTNTGPIPYYDMYGRGGGAGMAAAEAAPISAGQIVITADVSLVFQIQ
jgi:uncharacterized protein YggE